MFFKYFGTSEWPDHTETTKKNFLYTTLRNDATTTNASNDEEVFSSSWTEFE